MQFNACMNTQYINSIPYWLYVYGGVPILSLRLLMIHSGQPLHRSFGVSLAAQGAQSGSLREHTWALNALLDFQPFVACPVPQAHGKQNDKCTTKCNHLTFKHKEMNIFETRINMNKLLMNIIIMIKSDEEVSTKWIQMLSAYNTHKWLTSAHYLLESGQSC